MSRMYFRRTAVALACSAMIAPACTSNDGDAPPATNDPDSVAERRATKLVAQLTSDEKIALVHGTGMPIAGYGTFPPEALLGASYIPGIPRLGIPQVTSADSACGVNLKDTHATALPAPLALAASWDPDLAQEYGKRIAIELRTLGYTEGLGGATNLAREPRSGRTFENMGEDPVLSGTMLAARTIGTQGQKVIATVKHYAMNDHETSRMTSDSQVDERTMRETELLAFEIAIKEGQPGSVMCAYNKVNGTYACENPYILTDVLKKEWGFRGVVQSDWGATHSTAPAALAGLDEEQPGFSNDASTHPIFKMLGSHFNTKLRAAVDDGSVPMSRLDDMVHRKLRTLARVGIMDAPPLPSGAIDQDAGNASALAVARQSAVLLKNASAALPLAATNATNATGVSSIVVIGGHADAGVLSGGGSGAVPAADGNAVSGCQEPPGPVFIPHCATWYKSAPLAAIQAKAPGAKVTYFDGNDSVAAANAAAQADVAIVFATQWETEGNDLASLALPDTRTDPYNQSYDQNALIEAIAAKGKRVVVVLQTGSPVLMPWIDRVHAVLEVWYPGVRGGQAVADLLFGDANPSGKLPLSFPKQDADLPQPVISPSDPNVVYREGLLIGYRWYDAKQLEPLFPFGHGLSYTTFSYSNLDARREAKGDVTVTFTVTNDGTRAGAEVAQVYAKLPAGLGEPPNRLVGWKKVSLEPGQAQTIQLTVPAQRLATWDTSTHVWKVNGGDYTFVAGTSSRDPRALTKAMALP
ncbi:glycoside hydrolase family 3 C-terminal domain-containing protein [Pendulispora brunnea]|uniref:Glycoside hydrolase family 3 C-terminal domain-containing protein n=1 Tax=Pendulispora brunnea TaxID=2905690 RepID=A0ABZ2KLM3_9BACT